MAWLLYYIGKGNVVWQINIGLCPIYLDVRKVWEIYDSLKIVRRLTHSPEDDSEESHGDAASRRRIHLHATWYPESGSTHTLRHWEALATSTDKICKLLNAQHNSD